MFGDMTGPSREASNRCNPHVPTRCLTLPAPAPKGAEEGAAPSEEGGLFPRRSSGGFSSERQRRLAEQLARLNHLTALDLSKALHLAPVILPCLGRLGSGSLHPCRARDPQPRTQLLPLRNSTEPSHRGPALVPRGL